MLDPYWARQVALAAAIAHAEGFWVPGARPRRAHNPGDLTDSSGQNRTFTDVINGWGDLNDQLGRMLHGSSRVYALTMTWRQVAQLWTGGDNAAAWSESVCDDLELSPDSTLGAFAAGNPTPAAPAPAPLPLPEATPGQPGSV